MGKYEMNKYYYDEILRISTELSLLMSEYGSSISAIAKGLDIDLVLVREDILNIFLFEDIKELIYVDAEELEIIEYRDELYSYREGLKGIGVSEEKKKELRNKIKQITTRIAGTSEDGLKKGRNKDGSPYGILSGLYDDTVFKADASIFGIKDYDGESLLVLPTDEYSHLVEFLKTQGKELSKMDGLFKVKNSLEMKEIEAEAKYNVQSFIKEGKSIKFCYKTREDKIPRLVKIKPMWINYNADSGFLYIVDSYGYKYRFDRIDNLMAIKELDEGEEIDKKTPLKHNIVNVKILIRKKPGFNNLINKIKADVIRRNMDPDYNVEEHFTENDTEYIYIDQILDTDLGDLKSWIYSYGSSMVVLEPTRLRMEIIDSYKERQNYY